MKEPRNESTTSPVSIALSSILPFLTSHPFLLLFCALTLRILTKRYLSPLRSIPGPFVASFTRLWKVYSTARGRTNLEHIALHRKYGPLVRIAPNEVSLSSPHAARLLLSAGKRFYKTDFYGVFPPPENPDIFTETREDVHAMKKKVANVPYSMAAMRQLNGFIDDTIDVLASRLDEYAAPEGEDLQREKAQIGAENVKKHQVDLGAWLHYFAFDVLGEVAFGRSFGFLAAGVDVEGAIKTIDDSQWYNGLVGQIPELDHVLRRNPLWKFIPALDPGNALVTRIAREEMAKRRPFAAEKEGKGVSGDGREDLLASLIKGHLKDPSRFGEGDVFAVAHGAIFAGSDSTASTMQSFFWHILSSPRIHATLTSEIDLAVRKGSIPSTGNIEWNASQTLSYFQACLKEAMRVRPAVGVNITRYVPPEGAELDGHFFRGGTRIAVNGWVLHRDKGVFGQDADVYRPERWLEDVEKTRIMERFMFQFGGGSHVCIGRNLALLEINKVIPRLLRDFKFELVHPNRELKAKATFFVVQEGLEVYIERKNVANA
ncbi:cytochrome P450 [Pseudomassariella vexata]|uniref:Cytochrome P450 n=1 Tax=Pseudomassariella vexata TaxID=1141098 RepID=A0A1Y2ELG3_9PEZI|nr:cytochrome P450 [Pseudomassariella vexata]ORY72116.1 cytochrome P450 [Pseudomassariella vexata]